MRRCTRSARPTRRWTCSSSTTARATAPRPWPQRPGPASYACPSTSGSAAPCAPATGTRLRSGYDVAVQIDADGQHDPRYLRDPDRRARPGRHLHRQPLRPARRPLPRARPAPLGDVPARGRAQPPRRHHPHRRHVGVPGLQPACDDRLRRALPRRVPRRHRRVPRDRHPGRVQGRAAARRHAPARRRSGERLPRARPPSSCAAPWSRWGWPWSAAGRRPSTRACRTPARCRR